MMMKMHDRLKEARLRAGYKTATSAIESCGWNNSTYRAHENGQNGFKTHDAIIGLLDRSTWLIVGSYPQADAQAL